MTLGTVNGLTATQLATAGQANGTAVVAWTNNGQVSARVHTASGWSATKTISPAADTALSAAVAVRPDGSVVAVWNAQRTADWAIESAVRSPAGTWSAPTVVSSTGLPWAGLPALGVNGTGKVLAVWAQINGSSTRSITSAALPSSGAWSAPATIATPSASTIPVVSVAVNASGAAVIGWIRVAGDYYGDVVTRSASGVAGTPVTIATGYYRPIQYRIHQLQVAIDGSGRASAAWNTVQTHASAQQPDGTWAPATVFASTGYAGSMGLGMDSTGNAQLLWSDSGKGLASSLSPGGPWTPATAVLPGSSPIDVVLAPSGPNDFAGWWDTGTSGITAAVHTSAGWGTATRVAELSSQAWVAALSDAPAGQGALIAWVSGTSATGTVQASIATSP